MAAMDRAYGLNYSTTVVFFATLALHAVGWFMLARAATAEAIRSPWQVVPMEFFVVYGVAALGTVFFSALVGTRRALLLVFSQALLAFSVALVVYRLGYGFDPFIHEATAELLRRTGAITPLPVYGWGQYLVVVALSVIPGLSIGLVNRLLLPLLVAFVIPWLLYRFSGKPLLAALAVALPFPLFIMTTPQGLADLTLLALAFLIAIPHYRHSRTLYILAFFALITHPIAGIPALFLLIFYRLRGRLVALAPLFWIIVALAIPAALAANAALGGSLQLALNANLGEGLRESYRAIPFPLFFLKNNHLAFLDLAELLRANFSLIFIALALFGLARSLKKNRDAQPLLLPHLFVSSALVAGYVLLHGFIRLRTIEYEADVIPLRLLEAAALVMAPAAAFGVLELLRRVRGLALGSGALLLAAGLATASLYISYPRLDRYEKSPGFSVSAATFEAVREIEKNFPAPYIVLANQTAAAAVISEYGFRRYYGSDFYYAHPSGGLRPYRYFLTMTDGTPTRELAEAAAREANVPTVYFVIHHYWKKFDSTVAAAKLSADSWQSIADGKIYIFKFDFAAETTP